MLMDMAERQPAHGYQPPASTWSAEDDSPVLSVRSGSEALQLRHPMDADEVSQGFQVVQVSLDADADADAQTSCTGAA